MLTPQRSQPGAQTLWTPLLAPSSTLSRSASLLLVDKRFCGCRSVMFLTVMITRTMISRMAGLTHTFLCMSAGRRECCEDGLGLCGCGAVICKERAHPRCSCTSAFCWCASLSQVHHTEREWLGRSTTKPLQWSRTSQTPQHPMSKRALRPPTRWLRPSSGLQSLL